MTLYQPSIFFDICYWYKPSNPFLDYAPSYASAHQLGPVLFVQWLANSLQFFCANDGIDYLCVTVGDIPLSNLLTILHSMKSMDFQSKMNMTLHLPYNAPALIAGLLPDDIFSLLIGLPFDGFLDPSIVPECIRSLSNLEHLEVWINTSPFSWKVCNGCTTVTCSFRFSDARRTPWYISKLLVAAIQFGVVLGKSKISTMTKWLVCATMMTMMEGNRTSME